MKHENFRREKDKVSEKSVGNILKEANLRPNKRPNNLEYSLLEPHKQEKRSIKKERDFNERGYNWTKDIDLGPRKFYAKYEAIMSDDIKKEYYNLSAEIETLFKGKNTAEEDRIPLIKAVRDLHYLKKRILSDHEDLEETFGKIAL